MDFDTNANKGTKFTRLYIVEGIKKERVNINHTQRGEVDGLAWINPQDVDTKANNCMINIRHLNQDSHLEKDEYGVSWFVKNFVKRSPISKTYGKRFTKYQKKYRPSYGRFF